MKSKLEVGDIKIFTLNSMLEVIGKVAEVNDDYCRVKEALMIRLEPQEGPDGRPALSAALGPLSMFIDKDPKSQGADVNLYYNVMLGASDPQEGILNYYAELTGSIMAPPSKKIQMPT